MFGNFVVVACMLGAPQDEQLQTLVNAHSQGVSLIRSVDVRYTVGRVSGQGASSDGVPNEMSWIRENDRERFRVLNQGAPPTFDGRPTGINEWTLDGKEYRQLLNWDAGHPQRITPLDQGTVKADVGPQTNSNPGVMNPAQAFLLELDNSPRLSLAQLVRNAVRARVQGKGSVDGHETWVIEAESPAVGATSATKKYYEIHLDSTANYLVRKFVVKVPRMAVAGRGDVSYSSVKKVLEFRDFGDGVFFPVKLQTEVFSTAEPGPEAVPDSISRVDVRSIKVNESLPEGAFDLQFPKYCQVSYSPPVNGRFAVDIWGDDGPLRRVNSLQEIQAFEDELRRDPATAAELDADPTRGPSYLKYSLAAAGGVAVLVVLLLLGRRFRASQ